MNRARAIADVTAGSLLATVDIRAPIERVFKAISTEDQTKWWGSPDTYQVTSFEGDLRVGGRWVGRGEGFQVEGEYLAVEPPHRLVHTWNPSWTNAGNTTITWQLTAIEGGTRVVLRHEGFGAQVAECESHANGWTRVLGWLEGWASEPAQPGPVFLVRLIPPRPDFLPTMTAEEREVMLTHGAYWRNQIAGGVALAFGPVNDPNGAWGLGLLRLPDEAAVRAYEAEDPAIKSGRGFRYEVMPMLTLVL